MKHKLIAYSLNLLCIVYLLMKADRIGGQGAFVFFVTYYPVLVFINFAIWLTLRAFDQLAWKAFKQTAIITLLLTVPIWWYLKQGY